MTQITPISVRITDYRRGRSRSHRRHTAWIRRSSCPRFEFLEERILLNVDIVENSNDSGMGSLRQTIANATAGDTIKFDMSLNHVTSPITLTSGELDITQNLTIVGPGAASLTISGNTNSSRTFDVSTDVIATISGLTMTAGASATGGAILKAGTLKVADDVLYENSIAGAGMSGAGGAIYNSTGSLSVTGSTFDGNGAISGGGIYVEAGIVTIQNSTIESNTVTVAGGGIYTTADGTLTATNCTIADNTSEFAERYISNNGTLSLVNCTVADNTATFIGGGINTSGLATLGNTIVAGNSQSFQGSGADFDGTVTTDLGSNLISEDSRQ